MTPHIAAATAGRPRIADLIRAAGRKLSDCMHAAADDYARVLGWGVTETPGPLGLGGRIYRDPRFDRRQQNGQHVQVRKEERDE